MSDPVIRLRSVRKRYPLFTLSDIDLDVQKGRVLGLIGPDGAGKSTLLRILMGLVRADAGEVTVLNRAMPAEERRIKARIGFVSEDMALYGGKTLGWHMDLVASVHEGWDVRRAEELLARLTLNPDQKVRGMSRGQQVKAMLLLALARRALVESFLRGDPELARLAEALRADELLPPRGASVAPGAGRAALLRTKSLLRRRTWFLALAFFFSGLPLSCFVDDSGLRFLLIRDAPVVGSASLAVAAAFWIAYGVTVRRLRVSGL